MLKKIIDIFKKLFGIKTKNEETVAVVTTMAKAVTKSEVEDEEEEKVTKVLVNNCIQGYDLIKFNISSDSTIYPEFTILNNESEVIVTKMDTELTLTCTIRAVENGEEIGPLSVKVKTPKDSFYTINVTDILLGLQKITFSAEVEDGKTEEYS